MTFCRKVKLSDIRFNHKESYRSYDIESRKILDPIANFMRHNFNSCHLSEYINISNLQQKCNLQRMNFAKLLMLNNSYFCTKYSYHKIPVEKHGKVTK